MYRFYNQKDQASSFSVKPSSWASHLISLASTSSSVKYLHHKLISRAKEITNVKYNSPVPNFSQLYTMCQRCSIWWCNIYYTTLCNTIWQKMPELPCTTRFRDLWVVVQTILSINVTRLGDWAIRFFLVSASYNFSLHTVKEGWLPPMKSALIQERDYFPSCRGFKPFLQITKLRPGEALYNV